MKLDDNYVCIHRIASGEMVKSNTSSSWWALHAMPVGIIDWDVRAQKPPASGPNIHAYPRNILEETSPSLRRRTNLAPKPATSPLDPIINQCCVTSFKGRLRHIFRFCQGKRDLHKTIQNLPWLRWYWLCWLLDLWIPQLFRGKNPLISEAWFHKAIE